jgi:hypothetical protein
VSSITSGLCYVLHERASNLYRGVDSTAIEAVLRTDFEEAMEANHSFGMSMPAEVFLARYEGTSPRELGDSQARSNLKQFVKGMVINDLRARLHKHAEPLLVTSLDDILRLFISHTAFSALYVVVSYVGP